MNPEVRVTGFVDESRVGVGIGIVKEVLNALVEIGPGRGGKCACDRSDGCEHGRVDGSAVEEEDSNNLLDGVSGYDVSILYFCAVLWCSVWVWLISSRCNVRKCFRRSVRFFFNNENSQPSTGHTTSPVCPFGMLMRYMVLGTCKGVMDCSVSVPLI